jgi:GTP-binding protein
VKQGDVISRHNGVLVSMVTGKALGYALFNLQDRGRLFIDPNIEVYEGMVLGIHSRNNDLVINPTKGKQLTNVRASGTDENIVLTPPIKFSLEQALDFIEDDELVEVTPERKRAQTRQEVSNVPVDKKGRRRKPRPFLLLQPQHADRHANTHNHHQDRP